MAECLVCGQDARCKCPGCAQILYCADEHRKQDASRHKTQCKPYRIEKNQKYGRFLVANRDIKQGELLLRERPVVVGPRVDSLPACLECFTLLYPPITKCPDCQVSPLCPRCTHDPLDCGWFRTLSQDLRDLCLRTNSQYVMPLKVLLHARAPDPGRYKEVLQMEAHMEDRRGSGVWLSHHKNVVEFLLTLGAITDSKEDMDLVQQICGILDVNSFEVRGTAALAGMGMRLRGVYVEAALMAHDCITNVHLSVDDHFVMSIRASVDIPEGQPILYNYTDPLQTTVERQRHLQEGKYFTCNCRRCRDPTELGTMLGGLRCPRCRTGRVLTCLEVADWSCDSCKRRFSAGLMAITAVVARDLLDDVDRTDPAQLEEALKSLSFTFVPTHSILIDVKQSIVAAYRELEPTRGNLERKVELCRELLPVLRAIEPGISRLRGITLYELHVALVTLAQEHGESQLLQEAEDVLKEAVSLLLYEPTLSPEGELARQAMMELKSLKALVAKQQLRDEKKRKKTKNKK